MARGLVISDDARQRIKALIEKAASRPTSLAEVKAGALLRASGTQTMDSNAEFTIVIPQGYHVTYTHEYQREDLICRHFSVSVENAAPGMGPHPAAVALLLQEFGFKNKIGHMPAWESRSPRGAFIIEFIEPLDGDINRLRRE